MLSKLPFRRQDRASGVAQTPFPYQQLFILGKSSGPRLPSRPSKTPFARSVELTHGILLGHSAIPMMMDRSLANLTM